MDAIGSQFSSGPRELHFEYPVTGMFHPFFDFIGYLIF